MFSYPSIIEAAKRSGLPYKPTSTYRPGARTKSGKISHHAKGDAVDFWGHDQDALAAYFLGLPHLEVFHKSTATGRWYGSSNGNPVDEATHGELVRDHENHLHVAASNDQMKGFPTSNPFLGAAGAVGKGVFGPLDAAASVVDVLRPIGVISANMSSPVFWRRMGMGLMGGTLIVVGILYLNRRTIGEVVGKVGGVLGSVAGTAIQGAAFGVGAGATGALGAGKAAAKSAPPGPFPPRRELPSNAPTTAVLPEAYAPVSAGGTYTVTAVGRAKRPASKLPNTIVNTGAPKSRKGKSAGVSVPMKDTK